MDKLKIALLQLTPTGSLQGNLEKGLDACRKAKKMGADLALFPEMWSNGYAIYDRPGSEWMAEAIPTDSDFICKFGKLAQELEMAIGITLLETYATGPRNTLILFDREFPESARILMLKGAEVILTPNACPMEINRLSQLRARAYENMLCVATCNYPDTVPDCNGNSTVFDGVAYLPGLEGSRDTCILQADEKEGIYLAELDLKQLREYRRSEVHGNAYRRPQKYGLLVDEHIDEPFVRANHRAE